MMRAIIRRKYKDRANGLETENFETFDFDHPELEGILTGGGYAEDGYDHRELCGIELLPVPDTDT